MSASTQNQAFSALLFLYRVVLDRDLTGLQEVARAKRPTRLPVVLSRPEVGATLAALDGTARLACSIMYGAGLRVLECLHLRVKDVDFDHNRLTVRDGKGRKDRVTVLPLWHGRAWSHLVLTAFALVGFGWSSFLGMCIRRAGTSGPPDPTLLEGFRSILIQTDS